MANAFCSLNPRQLSGVGECLVMSSEPVPSPWLDPRINIGEVLPHHSLGAQYDAQQRSRRRSQEGPSVHLAAYLRDLQLDPASGPYLQQNPGLAGPTTLLPQGVTQDALNAAFASVGGLSLPPVLDTEGGASRGLSRSSSLAGSDWFPTGGLPVSTNPLVLGGMQLNQARGGMDVPPYFPGGGQARGMNDPRQPKARRHSLAFGNLPRPLGADGMPLPIGPNTMPPTGRNRRNSCEVSPAAMAAAMAAMGSGGNAAVGVPGSNMLGHQLTNGLRGSSANMMPSFHQQPPQVPPPPQQQQQQQLQQHHQQQLAALGQAYGRVTGAMPVGGGGGGGKGRRHSWCPSGETGRMALARLAAQRNVLSGMQQQQQQQQLSPDQWLLHQQQQQLEMLPYGGPGSVGSSLPRTTPSATPTSSASGNLRVGYGLPSVPSYGEMHGSQLSAAGLLDGPGCGLGLPGVPMPQGDLNDLLLAAAAAAAASGTSSAMGVMPLDMNMNGLTSLPAEGLSSDMAELLLFQQQQQQQQLASAMGLSMSMPGDVDFLNQMAARGVTADSWRQDLAEFSAYNTAPYMDTWEGGLVPVSKSPTTAAAALLASTMAVGALSSPGGAPRSASSSSRERSSQLSDASSSPPPVGKPRGGAAPAVAAPAAGAQSVVPSQLMAVAPEPLSQVSGTKPWDLKRLAVEEAANLQQHEALATQVASLLRQRRTLALLEALAEAEAQQQQQLLQEGQLEASEEVATVDFAYSLPDPGADTWGGGVAAVYEHGGGVAAVYEHSGCISCDPSNKLFVGNIGWWVTEEDLQRWFSKFGTVTQVKIMYNSRKMHKSKDKWRSREYGFVDYATREEAAKAIVWMDGVELPELMKDNCGIIVQYAKPTTSSDA